MDVLKNLETLQNNLPSIEEKLGDKWIDFKNIFFKACEELDLGNTAAARTILHSMFSKFEISSYGTLRAIRVRGVASSKKQKIPNHQYEMLLSQRMQAVKDEIIEMEQKKNETKN